MDEHLFKKEYRKKAKENNLKMVLSNLEHSIRLYPLNGKRGFYSKAEVEDDLLEIKKIEQNGIQSTRILMCLFDYWVHYARLKKCECIMIQKHVFSQSRRYWGKNDPVTEADVGFIFAIGFQEKGECFVLNAEKYKSPFTALERIKKTLNEKKQSEKSMVLNMQNSTEKNEIRRFSINWLGHEETVSLKYYVEKGIYTLKDRKIQLECKEEKIEETVREYFSKVEKTRRIKNIYEPPSHHLNSLLKQKLGFYSIDVKMVLNMLLEKGYSFLEIEEHAFELAKENTHKIKEIVGFLKDEGIIKFLNHYLFIYRDPIEKNLISNLYKTKEELTEHYQQKVNELMEKSFEKIS